MTCPCFFSFTKMLHTLQISIFWSREMPTFQRPYRFIPSPQKAGWVLFSVRAVPLFVFSVHCISLSRYVYFYLIHVILFVHIFLYYRLLYSILWMLPGVPMSWTCGCSNTWPFSRSGSWVKNPSREGKWPQRIIWIEVGEFDWIVYGLLKKGPFNKYLIHWRIRKYIYIHIYIFIFWIMCLHLAYGLHVLLTFAHAPWHLDMNFHRPGHPVSTTCQACWQISEFLSNTSTNREKVGRAAKSKDGLFVDGMISLSTWHFGSPRLWEILGFLAPKQTLQFTQKKSVASNRTTSNHRNAQWGTDSKWWRPSKNRLGSASGSIIRKKSIADYVCSRKIFDHQSENTTTFLLVVIPSVWLSKIRPQEMPSSPVRWSISLLKVSSLHLKPLGCLAAPAAIVPFDRSGVGLKIPAMSQSSEDDQRCIQRLMKTC